MLTALALSLAQLGDPRILRVLAKSLAVTLALLATLGVALWFAAREVALWLGAGGALSGLAGLAGVLAGVALGWLLFRAIAIAAVGLFADEVVEAVEARHYPAALASARRLPFARSLAMGAGSAGRAILVNLLASPLYLLLLVTGVGTAIGFFVVNALLLGRDLGDMVAVRHVAPEQLAAHRRATRPRRWMLGAIGTALLLVPFVNLLAPVLGAAMVTHLYHRSSRR
jgi:CysZ protein